MQNNHNDKYIKKLKDIADKNKGTLKSKEWVNAKNKYTFIHENGQEFQISYEKLKSGFWPHDFEQFINNKNRNLNFWEKILKIVDDNEGKILSDKWINKETLYTVESKEGLIFQRSGRHFLEQGWPKNLILLVKRQSNNKKSKSELLNELSLLAQERGGTLLTTQWSKATDLYEFEDMAGDKFFMSATNVRAGKWKNPGQMVESACKQIFEHLFQQPFEKTKEVLTPKRTGRHFALELDGYNEQLKIAFEYQGHQSHWDPTFSSYSKVSARDNFKVSFCKNNNIDLIVIPRIDKHFYSSTYLYDFVLKKIEEYYFSVNKLLPILNPSPFVLNLKITPHSLKMLKKYKKIAEENGGQLLSNFWEGTNVRHHFKHANGTEFYQYPAVILKDGWPKDIKYYLSANRNTDDCMQHMRNIAQQNEGKLVSTDWVDNMAKYEFQFKNGESFFLTYANLINRGWPKNQKKYLKFIAAQDEEYMYNKLLSIVKENNGSITENKWHGIHHKYHFCFSDGREFISSASQINNEGWPKDPDMYFKIKEKKKIRENFTKSDRLNELKEIAILNGGRLLSKEWINSHTYYEFEYNTGQKFKIIALTLINNGWPKNIDNYIKMAHCTRISKDEHYQKLTDFVKEKGGEVISDKWLGMQKKHIFKFSTGEEFEITPESLYRQGWPKDTELYMKIVNGINAKKNLTPKERVNELREIVEKEGGTLLEENWLGTKDKYKCAFSDGRICFLQGEKLIKSGFPKDADKYFKHTNARKK